MVAGEASFTCHRNHVLIIYYSIHSFQLIAKMESSLSLSYSIIMNLKSKNWGKIYCVLEETQPLIS